MKYYQEIRMRDLIDFKGFSWFSQVIERSGNIKVDLRYMKL